MDNPRVETEHERCRCRRDSSFRRVRNDLHALSTQVADESFGSSVLDRAMEVNYALASGIDLREGATLEKIELAKGEKYPLIVIRKNHIPCYDFPACSTAREASNREHFPSVAQV